MLSRPSVSMSALSSVSDPYCSVAVSVPYCPAAVIRPVAVIVMCFVVFETCSVVEECFVAVIDPGLTCLLLLFTFLSP